MSTDDDTRISQLKDQLLNPALSPVEIAQIERKIQVLESSE